MNILFLTGTLEPGRSGVGDYTALLSAECIKMGHDCRIVALQDSYIQQTTQVERQVGNVKVPALRLPYSPSFSGKKETIDAFLGSFQVDWLSLQYVCYAYHHKGLPWGMSSFIKSIQKKAKLQIMFHELWAGPQQNASWKNKWIGKIQRWLISQMLHYLTPQYIHTSTHAYKSLLIRLGYNARILPIFGNIPYKENRDALWLEALIREKAGLDMSKEGREKYWVLGLFGSILPDWAYPELFEKLLLSSQRQLVVVQAGKMGEDAFLLWEQMQRDFPTIRFVGLGEQPAARISSYLGWLDFGLTTTSTTFLGKSGSLAAFLDHGIPVFVTPDKPLFPRGTDTRSLENSLLLFIDQLAQPFDLEKLSAKQVPVSSLEQVSTLFLKTLSGR
jgi:hypothetical protein